MPKFLSAVTAACDAAFKLSRPKKCATKERSVPWWTSDLTILCKKALALRWRYQRTRSDGNLTDLYRCVLCSHQYVKCLKEWRGSLWCSMWYITLSKV